MAEGVDEHRIFVGGLDDEVTLWDLESAFSVHGEVFNVSLNSHRGYGFVSYYHKHEAENAIEDMHGGYLGTLPMRVEWAFGWPRNDTVISDDESYEENDFDTVYYQSAPDNTTVYCGGLSDITRDLLEDMFSLFGEIDEITCFDDFRNYAFVRFTTKEAAAHAICNLNGAEINHDRVICSWARNPVHSSTPRFELGAPSTSSDSDSSHSYSPELQYDFDGIYSNTTENNRTIYVGGLPSNADEGIVRSAFRRFGNIESVRLFVENSDYGFVRFSTKAAAAKAICCCDDALIINGETVRCNWSFRPDDAPSPAAVAAPAPSRSTASSSTQPTQVITIPSVFAVYPVASSSNSTVSSTSVTTQSVSSSSTIFASSGLATVVSASGSNEHKGATNSKEKKVDLVCKICMDGEVGVVFLPCGHLASCPRCAQKISNCPMCRKRITGKVRTYLS